PDEMEGGKDDGTVTHIVHIVQYPVQIAGRKCTSATRRKTGLAKNRGMCMLRRTKTVPAAPTGTSAPMKIAILKERRPHESRVAATPETVRKLKALGVEEIVIETGAGTAAAYLDHAYEDAGATIVPDAAAALAA